MKKFSYVAKQEDGKEVRGIWEAASEKEAQDTLARKNLIVTAIQEVGEKPEAPPLFAKAGIDIEEMSHFSYEMSILLESGIMLDEALGLYAGDSKIPFKQEVRHVATEVRSGTPFSEAVRRREQTFPPIFCSLVKSGEQSGTLPLVLKRLSQFFERLEAIRNQIVSAATYPVIVAILAFFIILGLVVFIVPIFAKVYDGIGVPIPATTRMFLSLGAHRDVIFMLLGIMAILALFIFGYYVRTPSGREVADKVKLSFPVMGPIFREIAIANFLQTMGMLYERGIKMHEAVELAAAASGNKYMERLIKPVKKALLEGQSLCDSLEKSRILPSENLSMIRAGEKSGEVGEMLSRLSEIIITRSDNKIKKLLTAMEPTLIAVIAFFVGGAVIALAAPILNISSVLNK